VSGVTEGDSVNQLMWLLKWRDRVQCMLRACDRVTHPHRPALHCPANYPSCRPSLPTNPRFYRYTA